MVNQQSKFPPHLADRTKPLRDLLHLKNQWRWGHEQQHAFDNLERALSTSEVLALYDARHETTLSADAAWERYSDRDNPMEASDL